MIIADIYLVLCAKQMKAAGLFLQNVLTLFVFPWGHGKAPFPVACCLVFSGSNWSLRLQKTQPIPWSISLLRELAPLSAPPLT